MKIYPNKANVYATKEVNLNTDIPLSYIDTQQIDYKINSIINESFKIKNKKEVLPYSDLNRNLICFFNEKNEQIDYLTLSKDIKQEGDKYVYLPYGTKIFNPKTFSYRVVAKKKMEYSSKTRYDLSIFNFSPETNSYLMPIFGDAPSRLAAPSNVIINNGDLSTYQLMNGNLNSKDFSFVMMKDNKMDNDNQRFDYTITLPYKSNLFVIMSDEYAVNKGSAEDIPLEKEGDVPSIQLRMYKEDVSLEYSLKKSNIYSEVKVSSKHYFEVPVSTDDIIYHNIFTSTKKVPILIEEHVGKGFIIYCSQDLIIPSAITNSKVIYEALMYVYLKAYLITAQRREWITDIMPDYIISNKSLIKKEKFTSNVEIHKMVGLNQNDVEPFEVIIDPTLYPYVKFMGMSQNFLTFEKDISNGNQKYSDPPKPEGAISIYTERQNIIYCKDFVYKIDDSLEDNMSIEKIDNKVQVTIKPFRHSTTGIYVKKLTQLSINLSNVINNNEIQMQNADFYIVCKQNDSASYFECVNSLEYSPSQGVILSTIQIRQDDSKTVIYDMRQRGGGLPEGEDDNFDCFDIGHMFGRPYRKAGSLIITLPKYLEKHKGLVMKTVKQYCVAEEYPIIIFKEEE